MKPFIYRETFLPISRLTHMENRDHGFTLLELLIVMAIVGILSAIAIPQFNEYKQKGFDMRAQADLRNVAIAEEAYFMDNESYFSCGNEQCADLPGIARLSPGVELSITAEPNSFTGTASHPLGSGRVYSWDSEMGGFQDT